MPPPPKDPARRRRTNRAAGAAILHLSPGNKAKIPPLPDRTREWHPETVRWWDGIWRSPMASEFGPPDGNELRLLLAVEDRFWWAEENPETPVKVIKDLAGEIRLQRACFGLTPIDRRRLEWEIDRGEEATAKTAQRRTPKAVPTPRKDPRKALA